MLYNRLYLLSTLTAFGLSLVLTPLVRWIVVRLDFLDRPFGNIKTHGQATPAMGGLAIGLAFGITLVLLRFWTQFPTGTLRNLRGILLGGSLIFFLGAVDDVRKPHGLGVVPKFFVQILAALVLIYFDIRIHFIKPDYLAILLTIFWVVGVVNAFNIIDIMDGLSASQAAAAALGFFWIALPSEAIYVNFTSAVLLGAAAGFLPYNFSKNLKIFMGDSGSLFLGFVLAAVSLGTDYSRINPLGVFAPLFILGIPIYDTLFVMVMRWLKGRSPFMGSRDHFPLRLEAMGYGRGEIVMLTTLASLVLSFFAFLATQVPLLWGFWIYLFVGGEFVLLSLVIARVKME
ncbi:MAG: undecaprenyl/decaprenyl-phosphate alpha-N-acetylglucosaminyl 1-phosphate transferase [Elusimicrobia bacterium]|nr:undecaprenyl/decaprenyl-phosphate alpha-N-acetylglucosaminyl 1-phosphate transferase [Elusimicrobiota bacterium]